jgi:hypothetical protein
MHQLTGLALLLIWSFGTELLIGASELNTAVLATSRFKKWYKRVLNHCEKYVREKMYPSFDDEHYYLELHDPSVKCLKSLEELHKDVCDHKIENPTRLWFQVHITRHMERKKFMFPFWRKSDLPTISLVDYGGPLNFVHSIVMSDVTLSPKQWDQLTEKPLNSLKEASFVRTGLNSVPMFGKAKIKRLIVNHNPLTDWTFWHSNSLEYLDVAYNDLKNLPTINEKQSYSIKLVGNNIQDFSGLEYFERVWIECEHKRTIKAQFPELEVITGCDEEPESIESLSDRILQDYKKMIRISSSVKDPQIHALSTPIKPLPSVPKRNKP